MNRKLGMFTILVAIALVSSFARSAYAGWVEVNRYSGTTYISDGKVKNIPEGESDSWTIIDVNRSTITIVNPEKKSYTEVGVEEFCDSMSSMMSEMMAGMSPEERAMIEQMMQMQGKGGERVPNVKVVKKGGADVMAGQKTTRYSVIADGRPYKDVWLAEDAPIMKDTKSFIKKAVKMSNKIKSCTASTPGMDVADPENSPQYTDLILKGWVMKEVDAEEGRVESEVLKLEKKDIPASEFRVPPGYRKMDFMEMMESQME